MKFPSIKTKEEFSRKLNPSIQSFGSSSLSNEIEETLI